MANTVYTTGCYNLVGVHHIDFLKRAKDLAGKDGRLIIFLDDDKRNASLKPGKNIISFADRKEILSSIHYVSEVRKFSFFSDIDCELQTQTSSESVFAKGRDYDISSLDPELLKILDRHKVPIAFLPLKEGYSTTKLVDQIVKRNS